jgi:glycosyltransferase involved in cell wall biosynthesis
VARVALICEPPDGGVAEHVAQLALGLGAHGHEPVVFASAGFRHAARVGEVHTLPFGRDYAHPHRDAETLRVLARELRRFDLVHVHAAKAGVVGRIAARLARRPVVYTPHCFPFVGEISAARRQFGLAVERALAPLTSAVICVCEDERAVARASGIRTPLHVVHNGCPPCAGAPVAGTGVTVGAVTVLRRQKRLDVLLDAVPAILAAVPQTRVRIVGDGPEGPALRAHPAARHVEFAPYGGDAASHLRELDVYVLPSSWEAFPIGVLEALACGVPQVATDVGGTREAVTAETGVLVAPRDPQALADAVIALVRDPERRGGYPAGPTPRNVGCLARRATRRGGRGG